jgi:hypothetical protein
MSEMSRDIRTLPKPIKGAGLTNAGVVLLQFLFILLVETIEYSASTVGIFTGLAIAIAAFGGFYLGRNGTQFATVVNPPIAFFISSIILIATVGGAKLHIAKFGLDLVTTLGGAAPYLVLTTIAGWGWYLFNNRTLSNRTLSNHNEANSEKSDSVVEGSSTSTD